MSFYVTLPSNTFSDIKNIQSNYSTTLKRAISIDEEYEVALTEISIPSQCHVKYGVIEFENFTDIPCKPETHKIDLFLENGISLNRVAEPLNELIYSYSLKQEYIFRYELLWKTTREMALEFNKKSKNGAYFVFLTKNSAEIIDLEEESLFNEKFKLAGAVYENYKFKFANKDMLPVLGKYIFIQAAEREDGEDNFELKSEIENLVKDKINNKKIPQFVNINQKFVLKYHDKIKLSGSISMIFTGLNESIYTENSKFTATSDELSVVNYAAVYTNIIEEQYFGDTLVPILRCVNLPKSRKDNAVIYFENPIYVRVNKRLLNSINIKIADLQGNLISFRDIFSFLIVTLHFRKRKNEQHPTL